MTLDELDQLMAESEKQFNELQGQGDRLRAELSGIDTSQKQLQGEYEAYKTMKNTIEQRMVATAQSDPATVVDPKPKKKEATVGAK